MQKEISLMTELTTKSAEKIEPSGKPRDLRVNTAVTDKTD
jgi:hypothetical protein